MLFFLNARASLIASRSCEMETMRTFGWDWSFTSASSFSLSKPNESPTAGMFRARNRPTVLSYRPPAAIVSLRLGTFISKIFPV